MTRPTAMDIERALDAAFAAVHGHVSAKTSEIYTKGYDRLRAAASAMSKMGDMDW